MATTHTIVDCTYADGSVLKDQRECPLQNNGAALSDTSNYRIVEDVESKQIPWWLLLLVLLALADLNKQRP